MFETALARAERRGRVEIQHAAMRFVNGISWLLRDPSRVVGRTPFDEVYREDKLVVRRYRLGERPAKPRHRLPVLLVPPLMVKPFIFDLYPERSLVAFLLERGFDVYLVDFGEPDHADELTTLDRYVIDWMPAACEAVKRESGASELSLLGYCMGAIFALCHTAANEDASVRNIVDIAAPADMDELGAMSWMMKMAAPQTERLVRLVGNVPGGVSSTAFRMLTPAKNVTRYADLFMNMWNREYVKGFDAMNQWVGQFIDYPRDAYLEFSREFVRKNRLVKGQLRFRDHPVNLGRVEASVLIFAGRTDQVAPARAVRALTKALGSPDVEYQLVPGGHMGVFAGATAPEHVWGPAADWLAPRSRARRRRATG